jgi:hypothetical protein
MMIKGPDGEETFGNLTKALAVEIIDGIAAGNEAVS